MLVNEHGNWWNNDIDDDNEKNDVDDDNLEYHNTATLKFDFTDASSFVGLKPLKHLIYSTLSRYSVKILQKSTFPTLRGTH